MNQTFGAFVRQKRMALGISLRGLAARLGLSPVYMSIIETDRKPAPAKEHLDRLAEELHLSKEERELFLDLAAASQKMKVPADLPEYIMERDIVRAALRTAKEVDATDEEWQEFIDRITKRTSKNRRDGPLQMSIIRNRCLKISRERCCAAMIPRCTTVPLPPSPLRR